MLGSVRTTSSRFAARGLKVGAIVATLLSFVQAGQAAEALNYTKNYFVTGDYVVAGVGLRGTGVNGVATGTINVTGVPAGADIVAAFLYWQTIETTPTPSMAKGSFDGKAIVGAVRGNPANPACWSSGGTTGPASASGRVYRADVLRYLPVDNTNSVRLANGAHIVKLPDSGATGNGNAPYTNGASLVIVYRLLDSTAALRAVVIYDGAFTLSKQTPAMDQEVGGFYQAAATPAAKMTHIVSNGQPGSAASIIIDSKSSRVPFNGAQGSRWDNPTFNISLDQDETQFETRISTADNQTCLTWSAIISSVAVKDTDQDGLLDIWETKGLHLNSGDATHPATFGTCADYPSEPCVNLPAMGASAARKDIFVEIDWEHGTDGHLHVPKLDALNAIGGTFIAHGIQLHFDVGNNYQTSGSPYVVSAKYSRGGNIIEESSLLCPNAKTKVCAFPGLPYAAQSWKIGYQAVKNGFPILGIPANFDHNRKDIFHYSLFAHALAVPTTPPSGVPASVSGVADRPGGDLMITLGLWRSDVPADDQTGSALIQAGTLMHELGHNLGLSHAGLYRAPNCEPNYPSVMNYLYQTRGLVDAAGGTHVDFSNGLLPDLNESSLSESALPGNLLMYRVRFYGPPGPNNLGLARAHCDGSPLNGGLAVRMEAPIGSFIDWNNNGKADPGALALDVDFNGVIADSNKDSVNKNVPVGTPGKRWLVDTNDWAALNLRQIGARLNVAGLSSDVGQTDLGQTDLGQTDLGQTDLGQTDLGQTDLGQTDLGQTDLGQTDLGQTDLGDVDYDTVIASLDATSPSQPLTATGTLTGITLNWGAPGLGQIRQYLIYRADAANTVPVLIGTLPVSGPSSHTYTDAVDNTHTLYNTTYTYFVASVDINGTISSPSNNATAIVNHLFIAANNQTRVYGNANPALSYSATGNNPIGLTGTTACLTPALQTSNVGTYPITCSGQTPDLGITYTPGTLTIIQAPLAINAVGQIKTYDGGTSAAAVPTVAGLVFPSQTVTGLVETFDSKNVGTRTLTVIAYTVNDGNGGLNYKVTTSTATGTINPAPASVSPAASTKVYGTVDPALTGTLTGFVTADGITAAYSRIAGETVLGPPYVISAVLSPAPALTNYTITYNTANFTITPAPAFVTPNVGTKVYGTPDPAFTGTLTGFLPADNVAAAYTRVAGETVLGSSYAISATLSPAGVLSNYTITYNTASFTITPAPASVAPNVGTKVYGTADSTLTGTLTGFLSADNVVATYARTAGETVLGGPYIISATLTPLVVLSNYTITYNTANFTITPAPASVAPNTGTKGYGTADSTLTGTLTGFLPADNVVATYARTTGETVLGGPYVISATLTPVGVLSNYTITYNTANFTITPATASVTANAATKAYGAADPAFTGTLTGFLPADNVTAAYTRPAGENVAGSPYAISATLSPAGVLSNYSITYNTANFTITPIAASVTANTSTKVYGTADPAFTGTLTGFLPADNVTAAYTRPVGENVAGSPYAISATLSPAGVLSNYTITYNTANFTITPIAASVTPNTSTKVYGTADPAFTGTLTGFLPADNVTAAYIRTAGENVAGSPYAISATLSPAGVLSNYTITYNTAPFTITRAAAFVTPAPNTKVYGTSDPVLTGILTGFLPADGITAIFSRTSGEDANNSPFTISGILAPAGALNNYNVTYNTAPFTITQAAQTLTFAPLSPRLYPGDDFDVTATATSGLAATFTALGDCTVTGATVHLLQAGTCALTAQQPGNGNYLPAAPVTQAFTITGPATGNTETESEHSHDN